MKQILTLALLPLVACQGEPASDVAKPPVQPEADAATDVPDIAEMATPRAEQGVGCTADEVPIFACNVSNAKRLAVCSSEEGGAQYRYGGKTAELVLEGGQWATAMYSGGGEAQIAFDNADVRYIVFSRMIRTRFDGGPNNPAMSDGVIVERAGRVVSVKLCDDPNVLPVQYDAAERNFPKREELFTYETERADP